MYQWEYRGVFVSFAVCLVFVGASAEKKNVPTIYNSEQVCHNEMTKIVSLSQFRRMNIVHPDKLTSCSGKYVAMEKVKTLVRKSDVGKICSSYTSKMYDQMEKENFGYHFNFPMPKVVEEFTIAMGYSIVAHCKLDAVRRLEIVTRQIEKYMIPIKELESKNAVLLTRNMSLGETDVIRVAAEIMNRIQQASGKKIKESNIDLSSSISVLKKVKLACNEAYEPVYTDVLTTTVNMTNSGYDYSIMGSYLKRHAGKINDNPLLKTWLNAMITCETLKLFSVFDSVDKGKERIQFKTRSIVQYKGHVDIGPPVPYESKPLPEILIVDPVDDMSSVKSLKSRSEKEGKKIVNKIYETLLGESRSVKDRLVGDDSKFAIALMKFIDKKLK